ncbi:MAG: DNA-binding response regulator [Anaerolineales bacterium]|nr:DNA-binding response regulator [Anaerolineales bacterium]
MTTKVILFADNNIRFLDSRSEFLENEGYTVLKASSPEKARDILNHKRVHLAILDIRLTDDKEGDISGLDLALDPAYSSLPKIMLTGFPSVNDTRMSLKPFIGNLPPAFDYISKVDDDSRNKLIESVKLAFTKHVLINWDLIIQWDTREPLSFAHLVNLIQPNLPTDILTNKALELEDLIRQIFYKYKQIRFGQLLWHSHQRFSIPVMTESIDRVTNLYILTCGDRVLLKLEKLQIENLAPDMVQATQIRITSETMNFGGILYTLPSAKIDTFQTLRDLLQLGKKDPNKTAIANLLEDVLNAWHLHGQVIQESVDLMSFYRQLIGLRDEELLRIDYEKHIISLIQSIRTLGSIEIERDNELMSFGFPYHTSQSFPDPLSTLYKSLSPKYNKEVFCRLSPGKLTADNILVDSERRAWLTDFLQANQAPQWWDFICLEAILRFEVTQATDLMAFQEFEECLLKPSSLDERLDQGSVIPELKMNIELIEQIRRQASIETGPDLIPYYAGLLAWAVGTLINYNSEILSTQADKLKNAHLLLGASMLAKRLSTNSERIEQLEGELRLQEDGRVWIGNRYIKNLSGLRLKLLKYLYDEAGKTVNFRGIVESVYGEKFDELDRTQNKRIRQEIHRLREEIEPDPEHPRYILTVPTMGYRLVIDGKPEL